MTGPLLLKAILVFIVMLMTIGINLEDNMISRLGLDADYLMITLVAVVFTGLLAFRNLMLVVLVVFLAVGANLPEEVMGNFGIDRDYLTGVLIAVVILPLIGKVFDL